MNDSLILLDPKGVIVRVNDALCQISGYSPQEVAGNSFDIFFEDKQYARDLFIQFSQASGIQGRECYFSDKAGHQVPVMFSASSIKNDGGLVVGYVCVIRDISELKKTEDVLWEAKAQLEDEVEQLTSELRVVNEQLNRAYRMTKTALQLAFWYMCHHLQRYSQYANDAMAAIVGSGVRSLKDNVFLWRIIKNGFAREDTRGL